MSSSQLLQHVPRPLERTSSSMKQQSQVTPHIATSASTVIKAEPSTSLLLPLDTRNWYPIYSVYEPPRVCLPDQLYDQPVLIRIESGAMIVVQMDPNGNEMVQQLDAGSEWLVPASIPFAACMDPVEGCQFQLAFQR